MSEEAECYIRTSLGRHLFYSGLIRSTKCSFFTYLETKMAVLFLMHYYFDFRFNFLFPLFRDKKISLVFDAVVECKVLHVGKFFIITRCQSGSY